MCKFLPKYKAYLKVQKYFVHPYELYTWEQIYTIITSALVGLCANMKATNSIPKLSKFLDSRSIYKKYGMTLDDSFRITKRKYRSMRQIFQIYEKGNPRSYQKDERKISHYKKYSKSHYYSP